MTTKQLKNKQETGAVAICEDKKGHAKFEVKLQNKTLRLSQKQTLAEAVQLSKRTREYDKLNQIYASLFLFLRAGYDRKTINLINTKGDLAALCR